MTEVFSNPDQVMAKFVLNIYHLKLQVCHNLGTVYCILLVDSAFWEFLSWFLYHEFSQLCWRSVP
jgi:hypothetical protein